MTIRELREAMKLTQPALAKALGVNVSTIGRLEHGRMGISRTIAGKVMELYGVELDAAAGKTGPEEKEKEYACQMIIQSPLGGEITPEQVVGKLPAGVDRVYVRVDHNKLWWVRGEEEGNEDIW